MKKLFPVVTGVFGLLSSMVVLADCPRSFQEAATIGPKILVKAAAAQLASSGITDFSQQGMGSATTSFDDGAGTAYLIQASSQDGTQVLSGVLKCDARTNRFMVSALNWHKPMGSGVIGGPFDPSVVASKIDAEAMLKTAPASATENGKQAEAQGKQAAR
ncbi:MAG: hypothetical protein HY075_03710 [Deltaproteobacteria bacterium]|nr:hypothetical protein [Deltaproteobacteria bacterium]